MFQTNGAPGAVSYAESSPPNGSSNGGTYLGVAAAVGRAAHHQHPVYVPSNRAVMGGLPQHHHHHPQYSPSGGPTTNSHHHFVGGSANSPSSWHHQPGAPDGYVTASPHHHHHHHHLGAGAPHHQTPISSPFYAQNAMMMSSWRAYDSTGFQRTSPYGKTARAFVVTPNSFELRLTIQLHGYVSSILTPNSSLRTPNKCQSLAFFVCNSLFIRRASRK